MAAKVYKYTVIGSYVFPVDMLRYDHCYPATSEDAARLLVKDKREITLIGRSEPTIGRWKSFLWDVKEISKL